MSTEIIVSVTERLHKLADQANWIYLNITERKRLYEKWTDDPNIGGLLRQIMEPNRVRVYIKDSIMGPYSRGRRLNIHSLLNSMSISCENVTKKFIKPQALLCNSSDLYTLSVAKEWKIAIMSAFERGVEIGELNNNRVFFIEHVTKRFVDPSYRNLVEAAGKRLDVEVQWVT